MTKKMAKIVSILGLWVLWLGCSTPGSSGLSSEKSMAPVRQAEQAATLLLNPANGKANAKLEISGSGFLPGEKILLLLNAEGMVGGKSIGPLTIGLAAEKSGGMVIADEKGSFKLSRRYPVNIKPGIHTLEARGDKGSRAASPIEFLSK
jgi:hypothetical protein